MFYNASNFNSDVGEWDVSKVTYMSFMFYNASKFNQNISQWKLPKLLYTNDMFTNSNFPGRIENIGGTWKILYTG